MIHAAEERTQTSGGAYARPNEPRARRKHRKSYVERTSEFRVHPSELSRPPALYISSHTVL